MIEKNLWINELYKCGNKVGVEIIINKFFSDNFFHKLLLLTKNNRWVRFIKNYLNSYLNKFSANNNINSTLSCIAIDQVVQMYRPKVIWDTLFLPPEKINFVSKTHPINKNELMEIRKIGMNFIALNQKIGQRMDVPVFVSSPNLPLKKINKTKKEKFIYLYFTEYVNEKKHWSELFSKINANIYLTSHRWDPHPIAAAAAMNEKGGISAVFQTSYYEFPVAYSSIHTDVNFSFSCKAPMIEMKQGSKIKYNICIGNLAQSGKKFFKEEAKTLRKRLHSFGAKKIISYFDQDSSGDQRWGTSRTNALESYQYLLSKVIQEKWLGLIIKPRKPKNIRKVLGDVNLLLDQALATGRCYMIENYDNFNPKNFNSPPSQCAMASDISIQEVMVSGTAGVEAALTGTPTLMMDRYGFTESQFYKLGIGKVVFNDWQELWENLKKHWRKDPITGFGDWSPIMDDIEPFRDGKASLRLTKFLNSLSDGFKDGLSKSENLEKAIGIYSSEWGEDKIFRF